jgi:uncharacterized protein
MLPKVARASARTSSFGPQQSDLFQSILSGDFNDVELETGSIPPDWVLSGNPQTLSKILGRSHDLLAHIIIWQCGAVSYRWHYNQDEAYIVISGEGFMNDEKGMERRYGPGDIAFFPAGTDATWRHPHHFKKVAILKESVWRPLGICLKLWNKFLRMTGIIDTSPLLNRGNSSEPPNKLS